MDAKNIDTSKFLSYVLRHQPEAIRLTLDEEGWVEIDKLIDGANGAGYLLDRNLLYSIVDDCAKKRFTISDDGQRIRAAQGHSTSQVNIRYTEKKPPAILYHGTASRFFPSIQEQGLLSGERQYVHLSSEEDPAIEVGKRYGKPVALKIKALNMYEQGFIFLQADNGVWLTKHVPARFIM